MTLNRRLVALLLLWIFLLFQGMELFHFLPAPAEALANPFTSKPPDTVPKPAGMTDKRQAVPRAAPGFMLPLIKWQQVLREKMAILVRDFKKDGSITPVLLLLGAAFLYGVLHSAGPGHGKAVALSYILATKPGLLRGLAFGNALAFTHGLSGICLVLAVKFIFHTSITGSLAGVTRATQMVSFSLVIVLGLFLIAKSIRSFLKPGEQDAVTAMPADGTPAFWSAVAIGLIPCPGVVMVMLFAASLGMTLLGVCLGLAISAGMALTLSGVAVAGISGKTILLSGLSRHARAAKMTEILLEAMAGLAVTILGVIFLTTLMY